MKKILYRIANSTVVWLSALIFTMITIMSLFSTTFFIKDRVESVIICQDSFLTNIFLILILWVALCIIFMQIDRCKLNLEYLEKLVLVVVLACSVLWVIMAQANPFADGNEICKAVISFAKGNYESLNKEGYFGKFPFQLGLLFVFEKLLWFAGNNNFIFLQILNALALICAFHFIFKIFILLFKNERAAVILLILFSTCFPAMLYCTFIYGTMYGFALSTGAVYFIVKYYKEKRIRYIIYAIPLLLLSVLLKNNYLIVFVALACLMCAKCLQNNKIYILLFIPVFLCLNAMMNAGIKTYYETRSGLEIHTGIPSIGWVAMGLQDGNKGHGWYNQTMFNTYNDSRQDTEQTAEKSKKIIENTIESYRERPGEFLIFILNKVGSQWNEPTYESLWVSEHPKNSNMHRVHLSRISSSVYHGKLNDVYLGYCNIYHLLIFLSAAVCFWVYRRKLNIEHCIFAIIIIGGFLFHILWEANSKYILTYFIYVLPYAAIGLDYSIKYGQTLLNRIKK